MTVELRDLAPGPWLWRQPHPAWVQDGRDMAETPLYRPEPAALVCADGLTAPEREPWATWEGE
jgi:hypothetical protein